MDYYLFMAVLRLRFCARAFSSCGKRGPLFIAVHGPLTIAASLVAEHRLQTRRLSIVAHGPSCSAACGIFPDQGSNPCPLHWQADSQPLRHQGSPLMKFLSKILMMKNYHLIHFSTLVLQGTCIPMTLCLQWQLLMNGHCIGWNANPNSSISLRCMWEAT